MAPPAPGRGKPRPLLAGVFRKACDYCVRSKRGCNGGKPCEQCVRRGQTCTYSQRRKSGPRGRPLGQREPEEQQVASIPNGPSTAAVQGTRTSTRRRTMKRGTSIPTASTPVVRSGSPASSPARTASMSSSSSSSPSPSDSSSDEGGDRDDLSDGSVEAAEDDKEQQQKQHVHKRSKISGPCIPSTAPDSPRASEGKADDNSSRPSSPCPVPLMNTGSLEEPPSAGASAGACAVTAATEDAPKSVGREKAVPEVTTTPSFRESPPSSSPSPSPQDTASLVSRNDIMPAAAACKTAAPPRQYSPLTVRAPPPPPHIQRSSSSGLPMWAREAPPVILEQQQHVQQGGSIAEGVSPSKRSSIGSDITERIGEIRMGSPEASAYSIDRPRPTFMNFQSSQAYQAPAFAFTAKRSGMFTPYFCAPQSQHPTAPGTGTQLEQMASVPAPAALSSPMPLDIMDFDSAGELNEDPPEDELAGCPWHIPSLTREMSLVKVVAALGGEQQYTSSYGAGFEGCSVNGWE